MSEQKAEIVTIVKDGNTIIIAHPPVRKETNYWELFTDLFKSETQQTNVSPQQPIVETVVQQPLVIISPVSVQSKSTQIVIEQLELSPSKTWEDWAKIFTRQNIAEYRKNINQKISQLQGIDERMSRNITKFKEENILPLGDIRIRSIIMSFSAALLYKLVSYNTTGLLRKSRNLGLSFVFMGYWFVPELFNPFIRKPTLVNHYV